MYEDDGNPVSRSSASAHLVSATRTFALVALLAGLLTASPAVSATSLSESQRRTLALRTADFILSLQNSDGAIPDAPWNDLVNEDSNMQYALIGLGAAYQATGDQRYLIGLERGIRWLAAREELVDPFWKGSWYLGYSAMRPYAPIPTSPGSGLRDVRGVDATSALFVYLLYLHERLSGQDTLVIEFAQHARAALDFVLTRNQAPDGFFYSSWQQSAVDGQWRLWKFQYSADQGDVYLGMQAGALLYDEPTHRYAKVAAFLQQNTPARFFSQRLLRYGLGRDEYGSLDTSFEGFNGIFPQGYLPWLWGNIPQNAYAASWLLGKAQLDGRIVVGSNAPAYSLSAAIAGLAAPAVGQPAPLTTLDWLVTVPYDTRDGGIRDTASVSSIKYTNVAGFSVAALLGFRPFD